MFLVYSLFFSVWFPCGRLSWLLISFWAHVNIVYHIIYEMLAFHRYRWYQLSHSPGQYSSYRKWFSSTHRYRRAKQRRQCWRHIITNSFVWR